MPGLRQRATAVILKGGSVLLIRRVKPGQEYFIFPGGGVDDGENTEEALVREVAEELCLKVKKYKFLFSLKNLAVPRMITTHKGNRDEYYFLIEEYEGVPEIGGPESERMSENNQYHLEWMLLPALERMSNVYPEEGVKKLLTYLRRKK